MFETNIQDEFVEVHLDHFMNKFKPSHICKICKKKIPIKWNSESKVFDGHFMADDSCFSELFGKFLPYPEEIKCMRCFFKF